MTQNLPLWSVRFIQVEGEPTKLYYRPFPAYPTLLLAWDLTPLFVAISDAITNAIAEAVSGHETRIADLEATVIAQQTQIDLLFLDLASTDAVANTALTDALNAYNFAQANDIARIQDIEAIWVRLDALENP